MPYNPAIQDPFEEMPQWALDRAEEELPDASDEERWKRAEELCIQAERDARDYFEEPD